MCDGWHPYFSFGNKVDNLLLKLPKCVKISVDERMIPDGKKREFLDFSDFRRIGDYSFDDAFLVEEKKDKAVTEIRNREEDVTIQVWQENGKCKYGYLQIFIPPDRESIAVEPMSCNINAFNNGEGLCLISPDDYFFASYGIRLL